MGRRETRRSGLTASKEEGGKMRPAGNSAPRTPISPETSALQKKILARLDSYLEGPEGADRGEGGRRKSLPCSPGEWPWGETKLVHSSAEGGPLPCRTGRRGTKEGAEDSESAA